MIKQGEFKTCFLSKGPCPDIGTMGLELGFGSAWRLYKVLYWEHWEKLYGGSLYGQQSLAQSATDDAEPFSDPKESQLKPNADIVDEEHIH